MVRAYGWRMRSAGDSVSLAPSRLMACLIALSTTAFPIQERLRAGNRFRGLLDASSTTATFNE